MRLAMTRNEESKSREVTGIDFYEMSETLALIESLLLQTWYVSCPFRTALVAEKMNATVLHPSLSHGNISGFK
jgi:hypothetical protein